MANPPKTIVSHRSAKSGEFVTKQFAKTHSAQTVREVTKIVPKKSGK